MITQKIGEHIKTLRKEKGISQEKLKNIIFLAVCGK